MRLLAATVADDCGLDVEAIESLRVAVDELCALAMADAEDGAELTVTIGRAGGELVLDGRCGPVSEAPEIDPIAASLLGAGSDSHELGLDGTDCTLSLRVTLPGSDAAQ